MIKVSLLLLNHYFKNTICILGLLLISLVNCFVDEIFYFVDRDFL